MKVDSIDRAIVDLLMEDGRMPAAVIARRLGEEVSERAVRYRIDRLVKEGVITLSAIPNPHSLGFEVVADVFIEVEPSQIREVAEMLAQQERVTYVACSIGERDVSIQVVAHDLAEFYTYVTEVVGKLPGVRKTTSSIVPVILKDIHRWKIPGSLANPVSNKPSKG
jgi:Lrp/AsnC family transcriptional regulator, regulator for asnA, asnC and gidA